MCGRYALFDIQELNREYAIPEDFNIEPNYNAAPTQTMPVVTQDGLELMRWGLIPVWAKDEKISYRLFNARSESVFEKPMWKGIIIQKKCLIPANGFYEWKKEEVGKQPFFIRPKDQNLFMFAGVWEAWQHNGLRLNSYSILTTEPNEEMKTVHNRMPVILKRVDWQQWLEADRQMDIEPLLAPYKDNGLELIEVSKEVNVARTNNETLIMPINSK